MELWHFFITHITEVQEQTIEHLVLTIVSMLISTIVGVSLGILLTRIEKLASVSLGFVGIIQTIPSLALLGFLLPVVGIGTKPAIIALFLYGLLPIVRNTYTGIKEVDPSIKDASVGMGMTNFQLLRFVELPLAFPIILAGIRTATVINVGVATLCALIAAGGLGEFIFRGISLNNQYMILAGAIPASLLALILDGFMGYIQKRPTVKTIGISSLVFLLLVFLLNTKEKDQDFKLVAGFNAEFVEREDGYIGLDSVYDLPVEIREMEISLMYKALYEGDVDIIDGFSTDGRVKRYDLKSLIDDRNYFPPYFAAPLVNGQTLREKPQLKEALEVLDGALTDERMAELNYQVDVEQKDLALVANEYLRELNIYADSKAGSSEDPDIIIGSKAFSENFLLAYLFAQVIENKTSLKTKLALGFGGTKLVFDALRTGEIDIYPEYIGTGYLVLLQKTAKDVTNFSDPDIIYNDVKIEFRDRFDLEWLSPLGFNNTFAIMMRRNHADSLKIEKVSDLSKYLRQ